MTKTLQGKLLGNNPHEPNENTLNKILTNQKQHCIKRKIHYDLGIFQNAKSFKIWKSINVVEYIYKRNVLYCDLINAENIS